jgi:hypothetical protein
MKDQRFKESAFLGISVPTMLRLGLLLAIIVIFTAIDPAFLRLRNVFAITQTCAALPHDASR